MSLRFTKQTEECVEKSVVVVEEEDNKQDMKNKKKKGKQVN